MNSDHTSDPQLLPIISILQHARVRELSVRTSYLFRKQFENNETEYEDDDEAQFHTGPDPDVIALALLSQYGQNETAHSNFTIHVIQSIADYARFGGISYEVVIDTLVALSIWYSGLIGPKSNKMELFSEDLRNAI